MLEVLNLEKKKGRQEHSTALNKVFSLSFLLELMLLPSCSADSLRTVHCILSLRNWSKIEEADWPGSSELLGSSIRFKRTGTKSTHAPAIIGNFYSAYTE